MRRHVFSLLSVLLITSGVVMAANSQQQKALSPKNGLVVEVLVFSGRPNPVFVVSDPGEIARLAGQARGLPDRLTPQGDNRPGAAVLGYRGIAVTNRSAHAADVESMLVRRSDVRITFRSQAGAKAPGQLRFDAAEGLERSLLELARAHGAINDALLNEIQAHK